MHDPTTESGIFAKLHTLFNAGIGPEVMNGYYTCETGNETIGGINHSGWTASGQFA